MGKHSWQTVKHGRLQFLKQEGSYNLQERWEITSETANFFPFKEFVLLLYLHFCGGAASGCASEDRGLSRERRGKSLLLSNPVSETDSGFDLENIT